jgi:hypothetical protein
VESHGGSMGAAALEGNQKVGGRMDFLKWRGMIPLHEITPKRYKVRPSLTPPPLP